MTTDLNSNVAKRPTFLKVLCILSFAMCGLMILIESIMVALSLIADNNSFDQIDKHSVIDQAMFSAANTGADSLKELIIQLVALTGVFFMWKMKKLGFYVYLLAESFLYFEFLYAVFNLNLGVQGAAGVGIEMIWPLPFDLAFIIMYATQLKFMTWKLKTTADTLT
jgi:hypothetical protein